MLADSEVYITTQGDSEVYITTQSDSEVYITTQGVFEKDSDPYERK